MVPQRLYCKESFIASIPLGNVTQGPSPQGTGFLYKVVLRMSYTWLLENEEMIVAVNAIYAIA